jgi:hypothetical protein
VVAGIRCATFPHRDFGGRDEVGLVFFEKLPLLRVGHRAVLVRVVLVFASKVVLGAAFVIGRHQVGAITIFQRGHRAGHLRRLSIFSDSLSGGRHRAPGQFARGVPLASQRAAMGAKGVGGQNVRARMQIFQMNLAQHIQPGITGERIRRPQWQAGVHPAPVQFRAGCAIKQEKFTLHHFPIPVHQRIVLKAVVLMVG